MGLVAELSKLINLKGFEGWDREKGARTESMLKFEERGVGQFGFSLGGLELFSPEFVCRSSLFLLPGFEVRIY